MGWRKTQESSGSPTISLRVDCSRRGMADAGARLKNARGKRADLSGADFHMAGLAETRFEGALLENANFRFANLARADFSGANVRGANFAETLLDGADFHDAENVEKASFVGARWRKADLPSELRRRLEEADEAARRTAQEAPSE